jgi:hypothetical protein
MILVVTVHSIGANRHAVVMHRPAPARFDVETNG